MNQKPVVLVLAGNDPSGGAGLAADMTTLTALNCHAAPIVTTITVQDTHQVAACHPIDTDLLMDQIRVIAADFTITAIKIGILGSNQNAQAIAHWLRTTSCPVILDPILSAGGGGMLTEPGFTDIVVNELLPYTTLITPNTVELQQLVPEIDDPRAAARSLQIRNNGFVLVSGGHQPTPAINNDLFGPGEFEQTLTCPRLTGTFHGSGCTLASASSAYIAHGFSVPKAVEQGIAYTWRTLRNAYQPGHGQSIPDRFGDTGLSGGA